MIQVRRWASKTFISEAPMPNVPPCWRSSKEKKSIWQTAIKLVAIPPTSPLLKTELHRGCVWSGTHTHLSNLRHAAAIAFAPPKMSVCFLLLDCQSKCSMGVSREQLTHAPSFCDFHLLPKTTSEELRGMAALPDELQSHWHCAKILGLHFLWWLALSTGAVGDREEGRWRLRTGGRSCWNCPPILLCLSQHNWIKNWGNKSSNTVMSLTFVEV